MTEKITKNYSLKKEMISIQSFRLHFEDKKSGFHFGIRFNDEGELYRIQQRLKQMDHLIKPETFRHIYLKVPKGRMKQFYLTGLLGRYVTETWRGVPLVFKRNGGYSLAHKSGKLPPINVKDHPSSEYNTKVFCGSQLKVLYTTEIKYPSDSHLYSTMVPTIGIVGNDSLNFKISSINV